jgi:hypothetical protein
MPCRLLRFRYFLFNALYGPNRDLVYKVELLSKRDYIRNRTGYDAVHKECCNSYQVSNG